MRASCTLHMPRLVISQQSYNLLNESKRCLIMSNLEQIEAAILSLPLNEFEKLRLWLLDLDYERWNEQIEQDVEEGKLESLAQEAIADFEAANLTD